MEAGTCFASCLWPQGCPGAKASGRATWEGWEAHTLLLQVEDEALPEEVEPFIAERVPHLNEVISVAFVKAF